jgi:hypothetical protein
MNWYVMMFIKYEKGRKMPLPVTIHAMETFGDWRP